MPCRWLVCLCLVGVLGAAGCGADPKAGSLPALPASSAGARSGGASAPNLTSASPSPTVPAVPPVVKPPEADQPDAAGAEAFARYWMAELNAAYASMDPAPLARLGELGCKSCANYVANIADANRLHRHFQGARFDVRLAVAEPDPPPGATVLVNYDIGASFIEEADGRVVETQPPAKNSAVEFRLSRNGPVWQVAEVTQVQ